MWWPKKCFFCKNISKYGHVRKNCSRATLKCNKCYRNGHDKEECNWSTATEQKNKEKEISDGMDIPEESNNSAGIIEHEKVKRDVVLPD